jgi:dTDP-4-amino-4,6-dideoxygalactose transaminase
VHLLIDPGQVSARIGPRTRAVMPVHLFGQMAPVEPIAELLAGTDIALVEDAAQAHGARRHGRPAGSCGAIAATSFYPAKNLGAYGDAGAVLTRDPALASRVRVLRNYGSDVTYHHPETGFNSRLDAVQAVVLSAKLPHLAAWNEARRGAAARYCELLRDVPGVGLPRVLEGNEHVWHLFVVRVPRRDDVLKRLHEAGIGAGVHYPVPIHLQGALAGLGYARGAFPVAERVATEILSLPLFPEISADQQQCVVDALRRALA